MGSSRQSYSADGLMASRERAARNSCVSEKDLLEFLENYSPKKFDNNMLSKFGVMSTALLLC